MSYCRVELCGCKLFTTIRMSLLWDFAILAGYSLSRRSIRSRWRQFITKESAISLAERRCLWSELTQLHSNPSFGIHCRGFKHHLLLYISNVIISSLINMYSQTCPSIAKSAIEVIPRKRNVKIRANQKLKSGIFCVLESGICSGRIRNPAPGIQNLLLSWITLHGAKLTA